MIEIYDNSKAIIRACRVSVCYPRRPDGNRKRDKRCGGCYCPEIGAVIKIPRRHSACSVFIAMSATTGHRLSFLSLPFQNSAGGQS